MNITPTKINAASGENFCGYALVRRIAAGCLIACAAMGSALAGPGDKERDRAAQAQRDAMRSERMQPRQDARQFDDRRQFDSRSFEQRADEQRRGLQMQQEQNGDAFRRSGRLTPDERRDLRRQINEAGMDIYPSRRR